MIPYKTFAVVGGDLRQAHVANKLAAQGKRVYAFLLEKHSTLKPELICSEDPEKILPTCDVVIFPLPLSTDEETINAPFSCKKIKLADCFSYINPRAAVLAGMVSPEARELARKHNLIIIDYLQREELAVRNAIITAEGALTIALEELPIAIFGSSCIITGFGRISKALLRILEAMGADVTIAARKYGAMAAAEAEGGKAVHITALAEHVSKADIIFNTVPAPILTRDTLLRLKKDALIIDLASKPGGEGIAFK